MGLDALWPSATFADPLALPSEAVIRGLSAPAVLLAIIAIHALYVWRNRSRSGQQRINIEDLTQLTATVGRSGGELVVVQADGYEFDAAMRTSRRTQLDLIGHLPAMGRRGPQRLQGDCAFRDTEIKQPLICSDDLVLTGTTLFHGTVKVAGDLIVEGHALFLKPVIVSGVIKVHGSAHFAAAVVSKGDAMVRGSITIGSGQREGWAVVGNLLLQNQLKLNGTIVATRAIQLKAAA